ncbi:MAG: hypothetical protein Q7S40_09785 [Opitutaceae bacterium]|nr:hypothetical protein [Opitutaceae bacterium]
MPPTARFSSYLKERGSRVERANFDVIVLIQASSLAAARDVQMSPAYGFMLAAIRKASRPVHVIAARNARRIGDVAAGKGLFLFNHFAAEDVSVMLPLWEYLAGWYVAETGLTNSIALVPEEGGKSDYAIINWARWDVSPLRHFWTQLTKPSFWRTVPRNLDANHAASMPIYCRLA